MDRINSYPKVYNLGHPAIRDLFDGPVVIEEKVDGSQFSFGVVGGAFMCRSRNKQMVVDAAEMFQAGVDSISEVKDKLVDGWIYRGEYLAKPHHNSLTYGRVPERHVVLWDIMTGNEEYGTRECKESEAERLGLELVPLLHDGPIEFSMDQVDEWLSLDSFLGGTKIEGVVIKNTERFGRDGKMLAGKFVSEAFKETNKVNFAKANPKSGDILTLLKEHVRTESRWRKSVERLRDNDELESDPRDIGRLIKEIQRDTLDECEDLLKERLWAWASPHISRGCIAGFPEWYKRLLAENQ
jgi:hypothetical protein